MTDPEQQIGRLAMRKEGDYWNAYYTLPNSMDGALLLGSISMGAVTNNPDRRQAFLVMMRDIVSDFIEEKTGTRPDWGDPESAAEHERAGSA